jgi:hypothetical protein
VSERVLPPARYLGARGRPAGGLTVFDHWLPGGGIPPAGAVLLVDPPALPGGSVAGPLSDPVLSGTDDTSTLLTGVDLTSLSVPASATRRITPPQWMAPVAWTPGGPLLVAGASGRQRVAVLAFDPARSNLPSLAAFPILLQNLLRWYGGGTSVPVRRR